VGYLIRFGRCEQELRGEKPVGKMSSSESEILAIWLAIMVVREHSTLVRSNKIRVLSDSSSATSSLSGAVPVGQNSPLCIAVKSALMKYQKESSNEISFHWIKGHAGIVENDITDRLAGQASLQCQATNYQPKLTDWFPPDYISELTDTVLVSSSNSNQFSPNQSDPGYKHDDHKNENTEEVILENILQPNVKTNPLCLQLVDDNTRRNIDYFNTVMGSEAVNNIIGSSREVICTHHFMQKEKRKCWHVGCRLMYRTMTLEKCQTLPTRFSEKVIRLWAVWLSLSLFLTHSQKFPHVKQIRIETSNRAVINHLMRYHPTIEDDYLELVKWLRMELWVWRRQGFKIYFFLICRRIARIARSAKINRI